jgi:hypothetical protein
MVTKPQISLDEIKSTLEDALGRRDECAGTTVVRVFRTDAGPSNWDAEIVGREGHVMNPECKRVVLAAKLGLQNRFDLAAT